MRALADYPVDRAFTEAYLRALVPDPADAKPTRAEKSRRTIAHLFNGHQAGADHDAVRGNAYGLLNAVTQFVDHYRTVRTTKTATRAENRMESVLYGSGARFRDRAYGLLSRATGVGSDLPALVDQANPNPTADDVLNMVSIDN
jgi:hypothetical protein